jgi:hypothetical protein
MFWLTPNGNPLGLIDGGDRPAANGMSPKPLSTGISSPERQQQGRRHDQRTVNRAGCGVPESGL